MAPGRNAFLCVPLGIGGWMSLLLKLLLSLSRVLWSGWEALSMIASSFASILSSATSSRVEKLRAKNSPCLLDESIQSAGVLHSLGCTPGVHSSLVSPAILVSSSSPAFSFHLKIISFVLCLAFLTLPSAADWSASTLSSLIGWPQCLSMKHSSAGAGCLE